MKVKDKKAPTQPRKLGLESGGSCRGRHGTTVSVKVDFWTWTAGVRGVPSMWTPRGILQFAREHPEQFIGADDDVPALADVLKLL